MPKTKIVYPDKPVWEPLQKVIGENCSGWMFMGMVPLGGIWVFLYKHIKSRRYLNLNGRGGSYRFDNGRYSPIDLDEAIGYVERRFQGSKC